MEKLKERFKKFTVSNWVTAGFMFLILGFGLYMSIGMSVKLAQGYTLFGDSSVYDNTKVETSGPTSADISVLVLYWVLTVALLALFVYFVFFRNVEEVNKPTNKKIVDGQTVVIKEKENENK